MPPTPHGHGHYREVCAVHGATLAQCRCPGPKADTLAPCPGPPRCVGPKLVADIQRGAAFAVRAIPVTVKLADAKRSDQGVTLTADEVRAVVEMLQLLASGQRKDHPR